MSKERSIVLVICLALFAVFCFAGTADAAGGCRDRDNDGYFNKANCGTAVDCNDNDAAVYPGAVEECTDGIDNDCNGLVDIQDPDAVNCPVCLNDNDGDGFYTDGGACGPIDCNDNDPAVNQGAVEVCDDAGTVDEDCDGLANSNDPDCTLSGCADYSNRTDCRNDSSCEWIGGKNSGYCQDAPTCTITENPEVSCVDGVDNDCDGATDANDPDCQSCTVTENPEVSCSDGVDNDCDGATDESDPDCQSCTVTENPEVSCSDGVDNDCDGATDASDSDCQTGGQQDCSLLSDKNSCNAVTNCKWNNGKNECRYQCTITEDPEVSCGDGFDNDCDGSFDGTDTDCLACTDVDGDGYSPDGGVCGAVDCNDADSAVNPGADDSNCNGVDENCSGLPDDGYITTATSCGVGECGASGQLECQGGAEVDTCTPGTPAADDSVCNGLDDNCNGQVDEDYTVTATSCGVGECAASGQLECQSGAEVDTCTPLPAVTEGPEGDPTCSDTLDNDCDGALDSADGDCSDTTGPSVTGTSITDGAVEIPLDLQVSIQWNEWIDCATVNTSSVTISPAVGWTQVSCGTIGASFKPSGQSMSTVYTVTVSTAVTDVAGNPMASNYVMSYTTFSECVDNDGDGWTNCAGDCQDDNASINPGVTEVCDDGIDNNCDDLWDFMDFAECCTDNDGDGYATEGVLCREVDCDDTNSAVFPGAPEVCNDIDDNCYNGIDEGFDQDGDGYKTCDGDCADNNASINPGATEICDDGLDNNCDGLWDLMDFAQCCTDTDGDGWAIEGGGCFAVDCDDTNTAVFPGAPEVCNDIDDNCYNGIDEGFDQDGDGYKTCDGDCADNNASINPGATEICDDMIDNNCDLLLDLWDTQECCTDADGDSWNAEGFPCGIQDCDDTDPAINSGADDSNCNGIDDNCDAVPDDAYVSSTTQCGAGVCESTGLLDCIDGTEVDDCTPGSPTENPEATCDDILDNDCDGLTDSNDADCTDSADAPHDMIFDCTACHDPGTYVLNAGIPNSKCEQCHTPAGLLKSGYPTAPDVITHYSDIYIDPTTGVLVNIECVECHNPMRPQINLAHIRDTIRGMPVIFTAYTGSGSFADGVSPYDGICEVCHTQTNHHQNDGTAPGGQSHNDGQDCTACHTHLGGFVCQTDCGGMLTHDPFDCTVCHVSPDTYVLNADIPNSACQSCHGDAAPGTTGGGSDLKVDRHISSTYTDPTTGLLADIKCVECHNPMRLQMNLASIRDNIRSRSVVFIAYTGPNSFADGDAVYDGICEVCHTQTNHHQSNGAAPGGQSHNDGMDCRACHDHLGGGFLPL